MAIKRVGKADAGRDQEKTRARRDATAPAKPTTAGVPSTRRKLLRIGNVRFQAGVGLQLEVVTAVQNLASRDNNVLQAQLQYNVALAQLDRAVGVQVKI